MAGSDSHPSVSRRNVAIGSNAECLLRSGSRPVLTVASEFNRLDVEAHESNRKSRKDK